MHKPCCASTVLTSCRFCHCQEVSILRSLNYDRNVVQFYGACLQEGSDPMLVTEYMEGATYHPGAASSHCTRLMQNMFGMLWCRAVL